MNFDALATFAKIAETGSFSLAAQRLAVTQSTISNRIKALEEDLGCSLFTRGRGGASLTADGMKLLSDAQDLLGRWDATRRNIVLPEGVHSRLTLGTPTTFDRRAANKLVIWLRRVLPATALHIDAGSSASLLDSVASRRLDAAILYLPAHRPGVVTQEIGQEELVLVAAAGMNGNWQENFIDVTWGADFSREFSQAFPEFPAPRLSVGLGILGAQYLLALDGAAYLTRAQARELEQTGSARIIADAPVFHRPIYLSRAQRSQQPELLEIAVEGLRRIVQGHEPSIDNATPDTGPER